MAQLEELREFIESYSTAPTLEKMPRRTLADKGIAGPTGAHVIEEVHTPFNLAYITVTTGSTAFQNIVGVTAAEIPDRIEASRKALERCGVRPGDHILFTYAPLVNVFTKEALEAFGVTWSFLRVSSRDALIVALAEKKPRAVVGESSFLRGTLEDAWKMGLQGEIPEGLILIAAGTPLDLELSSAADRQGAVIHDLYGCQEFGWITLDGVPLREDVFLLDAGDGHCDLFVGGLATGDRFPVLEGGHLLNPEGRIITYSRLRSAAEYETTILATTASGRETVERLAKTVLRIKAKIVRVAPNLALGAERTVVEVSYPGREASPVQIEGKTRLLDSLLQAQMDYQAQSKTDPAWLKKR